MFSDKTPEDLEKTTKMDEASLPTPPPKKSDDWVTAPIPAAKPKAQPASSALEAGTQSPTAQPAATSLPASSETPVPPSKGGFGSFLSNFGIEDPKTQQLVLIIGGAAILLCCACACLVLGVPFLGGLIASISY